MDNSEEQASSTPDDIEQNFLMQFSSMVTTDKEELIKQFQTIGENLNSNTATFFLDMSNWNLQAAVGCYFDYMARAQLSMKLVKDNTIGQGEKIPPNTAIKLTWLVQNNGEVAWPSGTYIGLKRPPNVIPNLPTLSYEDLKFYVPEVLPYRTTTISVQLVTPAQEGAFETVWVTYDPNGTSFGEEIVSRLEVSLDGTMAVTQQLYQENFRHNASNFEPAPDNYIDYTEENMSE